MSEHTPGPWRYRDWNGDPTVVAVVGDGLWVVTTPNPNLVPAANARLIAAAPDLLEACEKMLEWDDAENSAKPYADDNGAAFHRRMELCDESFVLARAAIAKTRGE